LFRLLDNVIRSATTDVRLVTLARTLRIASPLKWLEYRIRGPNDGVVRHNVLGVEVLFSAPNATQFRTVEQYYAIDETDFLTALYAKLWNGGVCYDVGSNCGQFVIPLAKVVGQFGQVIAFEPHPGNYERLARNIELNQLGNVRVFGIALGDRECETDLFGAWETATIVPRAAAWHGSKPFGKTMVARGDEFRQTAGLPVPKAVKIDVEGAEYAVLQGLLETLSNPICELLCCEIHPPFLTSGVSPEMIVALVGSLGFKRIHSRARGSEIHLIAEKVPAQH